MDLVPKPDQVVSAAGNVAQAVLYGGLADLRPMPRTSIGVGELRRLYHYRPATGTGTGDPVLCVPPPAASSAAFDLRRGCSLVEHLVSAGHPTYLVDYGEVSFKDRDLDLRPWVDDVVPTAIRDTSAHASGRPVHVVAWSLGGVFALLAAAAAPDLPIASISVLGSPVDLSLVPLVAPARPLLDLRGSRGPIAGALRALGGAPPPLLGWALQLSPVQRLLTRPVALVAHLDDAEHLAQLEAVERLTAATAAYPGRTFGQLHHRFVPGGLVTGRAELEGRTLDLAEVTAPVQVVAGATDTIAPIASVKAVVALLSGSAEVRFEIVPGGHLGMLTGRAARDTTWVALDEWIDQWASTEAPADPDAIGANPRRRYGSKGSRGLAR